MIKYRSVCSGCEAHGDYCNDTCGCECHDFIEVG